MSNLIDRIGAALDDYLFPNSTQDDEDEARNAITRNRPDDPLRNIIFTWMQGILAELELGIIDVAIKDYAEDVAYSVRTHIYTQPDLGGCEVKALYRPTSHLHSPLGQYFVFGTVIFPKSAVQDAIDEDVAARSVSIRWLRAPAGAIVEIRTGIPNSLLERLTEEAAQLPSASLTQNSLTAGAQIWCSQVLAQE